MKSYLEDLHRQLAEARTDQKWEYSKGRVTSALGYDRLIKVLEMQVREMEEVYYGTD